MPVPAAALPAWADGPGGRPTRAGPLLVLAAAVLAGHGWLVQALAPERVPLGLPRPAALQVRSVVLPAGPAAVPGLPVLPPWTDRPAVASGDAARPARRTDVTTAPAPALPATADLLPPRLPDTPQATVPPVAATLADAPTDAAPVDGEPPPLYATRLPPPARLHYTLQRHGHTADALLTWAAEGDGYRLDLQASGPAGRVLLAQASTGRLDANGLAPERFVDRRAAGPQRAANFRRDIGRIGYSGPPHSHPAWPGAQDRLSWLAQLVGVLAAHPVAPPEVVLFVADATGQAGPWRLQRQPDATGPTPWGDLPLQHWQRLAPRPEALQVDVWFAAPGRVAAATPWPLRLRFSVPRSGDVLDLTLAAPP